MQWRLKILIGFGGGECVGLRSYMHTQSLFIVRMYTSIFQKLTTNEIKTLLNTKIKIRTWMLSRRYKTHDCRLIIPKVTRMFLTKRCKNIYSSLVFQCLASYITKSYIHVYFKYTYILYTRIVYIHIYSVEHLSVV